MMIFFASVGLASHTACAAHRRLIGGIHVRRQRLEFGGAGIDALVAGPDVERVARCAHRGFLLAGQLGQARVGKAHGFEAGASPWHPWAGRSRGSRSSVRMMVWISPRNQGS